MKTLGRRAIGMFLILILFLIPVSAVSAQKIIPGNICKISQQKILYLGKTYTCIRSKKKLIWNKGIASPAVLSDSKSKYTPTPTPNLTPSSTPKSSPTSTPTSSPYDPYEKYGPLAKEYRELDLIARFHASRLKGAMDKRSSTLFAEVQTDLVNKYLAEATLLSVNLFRYYEPNLPNQDIYLYYSFEWADRQLIPRCPSIIEQVHEYGKGTAGCGKLFLINMEWGKTITAQGLAGNVGHELFHNLQMQTVGGPDNYGGIWSRIPSWFREGSAQVGGGLAVAILENSENPSYGTRRWDWPNDQATCSKALDLWIKSDEPFGHSTTNYCEGGLGTIMIQMLISQKQSLQPVLDVYKDVYSGMDFRSAFKKNFGVSFETFVSEVKDKLKSMNWKF